MNETFMEEKKHGRSEASGTFRIIGITGEAGAGKTVVLSYLKEKYPCEILMADEIGNEVKEPGARCYDAVVELLGNDILCEDGTMNKALIAERIFADKKLLEEMNAIIHPAVHDEIFERIERYRKEERVSFVFLEAALLIEAGYVDEIDELWYISSDAVSRRNRLKFNRGYTDGRIDGIMDKQLKSETFLEYADRVIVNNTTKEELYQKIDDIMGEYRWEK